ncbi:MAG TPA: lipoyl(octanoyl) transferase [Candidatus Binatia bacterium]|nr:lipoyl(octanoyl) transferase [Candidatus Binatia bacterium]
MISVVQLGTVDYALGLRMQRQLVALRKEEKIGDVLLLLEHKPVITLGRNAKAANVVASPELLSQRGVERFECDRGGDVTFHGPGQIVGYPIFDLRGFASANGKRKTLGAVEFVRRLEDVLMRTCADFGLSTKRIPGLTGVWTDPPSLSSRAPENDSLANRSLESRDPGLTASTPDPESSTSATLPANTRSLDYEGRLLAQSSFSARDDSTEQSPFSARDDGTEERGKVKLRDVEEAKLGAIGVHISRFVTSHGFALNVNTDLSYFNLIIPCGITAKPVTSMQQELAREPDLNAVAEAISRHFGVVFQSQMLWVDTIDALLGRAVGVPMQVPAGLRRLHGADDVRSA